MAILNLSYQVILTLASQNLSSGLSSTEDSFRSTPLTLSDFPGMRLVWPRKAQNQAPPALKWILVFAAEILDRKNIPGEVNLKFGSVTIYSIFSELGTNHIFPAASLFLMDVPTPSSLFLLVYFFPLLLGVKRKLSTYFQMLHLHVQSDTAVQLGTEGG